MEYLPRNEGAWVLFASSTFGQCQLVVKNSPVFEPTRIGKILKVAVYCTTQGLNSYNTKKKVLNGGARECDSSEPDVHSHSFVQFSYCN